MDYDVIIAGGSYAGLSAALSLGRALKNVLIIDSGDPCNKQTPHSHNFITQDGIPPATISAIALDQVLKYPTVQFIKDTALSVTGTDNDFSLTTASGKTFQAKKLLFTTGIKDTMPAIEGFSACWGISVIHCPFCHGYEYKGQTTGLLMNGEGAVEHATFLSNWTNNFTIFTNGKSTLGDTHLNVVEKEIKSIQHTNGQLEYLIFADGSKQALDALYARLPFVQHSSIPQTLGCTITEQGYIKVNELLKTNIPGIFAAGDNSSPMRSVSGAVAAGTMAGVSISRELITAASSLK